MKDCMMTSFRLLTEYRSFLFLSLALSNIEDAITFPSPYGVSFILIEANNTKQLAIYGFRLLTEYRSFLFH